MLLTFKETTNTRHYIYLKSNSNTVWFNFQTYIYMCNVNKNFIQSLVKKNVNM